MKKTSILVNKATKVVNMTVAGQMTMEDAKLFVGEYKTKIGPLNGSEFDLVVDCTEMKVLTPELSEDLTGVMKMYKDTGFKTVTYNIKGNAILKMQLTRICRNAGLTQGKVAEVA